MDDKRKCFTFMWKIQNFSFMLQYPCDFYSPDFFVHAMCRTKWSLKLASKENNDECFLSCLLVRRPEDLGPDQFELDYEISFVTSYGFVIHSQLFMKKTHEKVQCDSKSPLISNGEVFLDEKLFLQDDTLTIRCRMWKSQESFSHSANCSVETRILAESRTFIGKIERFSSQKINRINMVCDNPLEKEVLFPSIYVCNENLSVEIKSPDHVFQAAYKLKVFILDVFKNKVRSCEEGIFGKQLFPSPLVFSKGYLIENKDMYLPNDTLTLHCEVAFTSVGKISGIIEITKDLVYEYDCKDTRRIPANTDFEESCTKSLTLKDDLISLLNEGILCDIKLKTATETIPAHTVVLSARSLFFRSMFSTEMRENTNKWVDIEDLDADTVRKMLLFMYSDKLDNLDYESAKSLYLAANKYKIVSLKHKCSIFFKQNLLFSNFEEVLNLAENCQDVDLQRCLLNFTHAGSSCTHSTSLEI